MGPLKLPHFLQQRHTVRGWARIGGGNTLGLLKGCQRRRSIAATVAAHPQIEPKPEGIRRGLAQLLQQGSRLRPLLQADQGFGQVVQQLRMVRKVLQPLLQPALARVEITPVQQAVQPVEAQAEVSRKPLQPAVIVFAGFSDPSLRPQECSKIHGILSIRIRSQQLPIQLFRGGEIATAMGCPGC